MNSSSNSVKYLASKILTAYNAEQYELMIDLTGALLVATNWDNRACDINDAAFGLAYPTRFVDSAHCHAMASWVNHFLKA